MPPQIENQTERALVIATYSREMSVRRSNDQVVRTRIKGKKLKPVCGDTVTVNALPNEPQWLITGIEPRRNELKRPNQRGSVEVLAANVDFLCVVAAPAPKPDWFVVDRYLCAAELMGARAALVFNKVDLLSAHNDTNISQNLADYERLEYPVIRCSAETGENLASLLAHLQNCTSIIVGQSGVGKSSIINKIAGDQRQRTANLSTATGEGVHTTVNSSMLTVGGGGQVIDSPGVRDYAPSISTFTDIARGFREISAIADSCRFANCRHLAEPNCAVLNAVEDGNISERRYKSYRRLIVMSEQVNKSHGGQSK